MDKSNNLVGTDVVRAALSVLREKLPAGDTETCVSALDVAKDKRVAKAFTVSNTQLLRTLIRVAASEGQLTGFASRRGAGGGIHRAPLKRTRRKNKTETTETTESE